MDKGLVVKFEDAKLSGIPLPELLTFLQSFNRLLDSHSRQICKNNTAPTLSLAGIGDNGASLALQSTSPEETIESASCIFEAIAENRPLPKSCRNDAKVVAQTTRKWGKASLFSGEKEIASIAVSTEDPSEHLIVGKTTFYGKLVRIGGAEPKAWINLDSGDSVNCTLEKTL